MVLPSRMNLDDLAAFHTVLRHGAFQAAAVAEQVPRSRLRRQVERLEGVVGVPLLHRGAHGVEATSAGRILAEDAERLLEQATTTLRRARSADARAGVLRLVVPLGISNELRATALGTLRMLEPRLRVHVVEVERPRMLQGEPWDVLMHIGAAIRRDGWFTRVFARVPVRLFAAPEYLAAAAPVRTVAELADHPLLAWRWDDAHANRWPTLDGGSISLELALSSANLGFVAQAARDGLGIALLPVAHPLAPPFLDTLTPVLPEDVGAEITLRVVTRVHSTTDPRIQALLDNYARLMEENDRYGLGDGRKSTIGWSVPVDLKRRSPE